MSESPDAVSAAAVPFAEAAWQALPAPAAQLAMISGALAGFVLALVSGLVLGWRVMLVRWDGSLWATIAGVLVFAVLGAALGVWLGYRRWKFAAWRLDAQGLQVRRGRWWRKEILVPRSRVQHLDIERGPIERHFGLATLIVHTAGTRLHALRQPGFLDADAVALRDALVPASNRSDDVL
ncbi:PH domain-containing protein [Arenimonas oryziterrae]|uniref:YdbS-like PH domain-containing protein n=1 Tax=Arenimonas oryziterrae DSM 21050 = YC6267 TaxID=1121015 RepID=A0A091AX95_9GAMM|nr:PH domain-containing protein [Arenimonas oryziterrae]KFN44056.1 hypothetical protein N789_06480 [Arenimonas oryziterrae DSM 21050 = YC6267]